MFVRFAFVFGTLAIALAGSPARAHEVETETVLICDTQEQAERFAALYAQNAKTALGAVNAEANNPTACAYADIAYVRGGRIGTTGTGAATFAIVPVLALGVQTPAGLRQVPPPPYYLLVPVREVGD